MAKGGRDSVTSMDKLFAAFAKTGAITKIVEPWKRYPTEILSLDLALHGGLPKNAPTMLYGDQGTGKSTMAYLIIANAIRRGERVLLLDMEDSLDKEYAEKVGIDLEATDSKGNPLLIVMRAASGEAAWETIRYALESKLVDLIVIDTLAKFAAQAMLAADVASAFIGVDARMNTHALKVISEAMYTSDTAVLILNQVRVDIATYQAPPTAPGGKAVKHENKLELKTASKETFFGKKGEIVGFSFKFTIKKSKLFLVSPKVVFELRVSVVDGVTVDTGYELYAAAVACGLFKDAKGQPWVNRVAYYEGEKVGDGESNIIAFLGQPSPLQAKIAEAIIERMQDGIEGAVADVSADAEGGAEPLGFEGTEDPD